jgi:hypothetical protein
MLPVVLFATACSNEDGNMPSQQNQKEGEAKLEVNFNINSRNTTRGSGTLDNEDYLHSLLLYVFDRAGNRITYNYITAGSQQNRSMVQTLTVPRGTNYKVVALINCGTGLSVEKYDDLANVKIPLDRTCYDDAVPTVKQDYQTTKSIPMCGETTVDVQPQTADEVIKVNLPVTRMVARVSLSQIKIAFPEFDQLLGPLSGRMGGLSIRSAALQNVPSLSDVQLDPTVSPNVSDYLNGMTYYGDPETIWLNNTYPYDNNIANSYNHNTDNALWGRGDITYFYTYPNNAKDKPTKLILKTSYLIQDNLGAEHYSATYYYPVVINTGKMIDKDGNEVQGDGIIRRNMVYDVKITLKGPGNDRPEDTFDGNIEVTVDVKPWDDGFNQETEIYI